MKAALLDASRRISIAERPKPASDQEWALVRVRAAGVCGTELHFLDAILAPNRYPIILGHEVAGLVEEAPAGSPFRPGDPVVVYNMIGCGQCVFCRTGREELCEDVKGQIGFTVDGGFAEFVRVPLTNLIPLPESVPFETAAVLACSGMTAVHAVRLSGLGLGDTAVINGVGGVGLMVLQVARLAGAQTIAVADSPEKLKLAADVGAKEGILVSDRDGYASLPERVRQATAGRGADFFFELVGTQETMAAGVKGLAKSGTFVCIGYTADNLVVSPVDLIVGELKIVASVAAAKRDLETAIQLAAEGRLRATIDTRFPLEQIEEALRRLRERRVLGRNVLVFD